MVNNSLRAVLGKVPLEAVISDRRELLMQEVSELVVELRNSVFLLKKLGSKRLIYLLKTLKLFIEECKERQQEAAQIRAVGNEKARFITAESENKKQFY